MASKVWGEIPKLQLCNRWSLGMDKEFHPTFYNGCHHLSMLWLKLRHVSKRSSRTQTWSTLKAINMTVLMLCHVVAAPTIRLYLGTPHLQVFTLQWHPQRVGSNHRQLECLFKKLHILTTKISNPTLSGLLWGKSTDDRCFPTQRPVMRKRFQSSWRHHDRISVCLVTYICFKRVLIELLIWPPGHVFVSL